MIEAPRVDLVEDDDDTEALLAEMEEPTSYREAAGVGERNEQGTGGY
jgi:hypothetical protein